MCSTFLKRTSESFDGVVREEGKERKRGSLGAELYTLATYNDARIDGNHGLHRLCQSIEIYPMHLALVGLLVKGRVRIHLMQWHCFTHHDQRVHKAKSVSRRGPNEGYLACPSQEEVAISPGQPQPAGEEPKG